VSWLFSFKHKGKVYYVAQCANEN
jgi:hypothetical protein